MTDDRQPTAGCLDAETLAAFMDGRLEPRERAAVEAHLAECEDCYEMWMDANAIGTAVAETAPLPAVMVPERRPLKAVIALSGIAATVALTAFGWWWFTPANRIERAVGQLVSAAGTQRVAEARLSAAFPWGQVPSVTRGPATSSPPALQIAALELRQVSEAVSNAAGRRGAGLSYLVTGDFDAAISSLVEAVSSDPASLAARVDLSAALFERWKATGRAEDLGRSLEQAGAALALDPASPTALFNQALAWTAMNVSPRAIDAWRRFLDVEPSGPWAEEARSHIRELEKGREASAGSTAFDLFTFIEGRALPAWSRAPDAPDAIAQLATARAHATTLASDGRDTYLLAIVTAAQDSARWPPARKQALARGIGAMLDWRTLLDAGDYKTAEATGTAALQWLNAAGVDASEAELEVGYSAFVANRTAEALTRLVPLEARALDKGFLRIAARAGRLRALSAMFDTRVSEAQDRYQAALALAERSGDVELESLVHTFLAESYAAQGDSPTAWRHMLASLKPFPYFVAQRQRFDSLSTAASVSRRTGLHEASLLFGGALLDTTREWTNPEGRIGGHLHIARALTQLSRGDHGVAALQQAADLLPDLASRPQAQKRLTAEVAFARAFSLAGQDDGAALTAADEAYAYFGTTVRVRLAELLLQRGRIHASLGHDTNAMADWQRGIDIIEDQRPALRNELLRISRTASLWDLYTEAINLARTDPSAALEIAERSHARELLFSLEPSRSAPRPSIADARALLGGAVALVYQQLPTRLLVWVITEQGIRMSDREVTPLRLGQLIDAFVANLDRGPASDSAIALAKELLPAGLALQPDKALVIVPDGALFRVPFAALPAPDGARPLVEAAIPIVAPSLATFALASSSGPAPLNRSVLAIGVGAAVPEDRLDRLSNAEGEASAVAEHYRDKLALTGGQASREAVLAHLPRYDIIHFAGHAMTDAEFPLKSRLYVGDGVIAASDVSSLSLRPRTIAVLGACDTARGPGFQGEGPLSLVRAFLAAGASNVVATLWRVRDDDASALLLRLHTHLSNGTHPAAALALSQRALATGGTRPSAWSGFVVVGGTT